MSLTFHKACLQHKSETLQLNISCEHWTPADVHPQLLSKKNRTSSVFRDWLLDILKVTWQHLIEINDQIIWNTKCQFSTISLIHCYKFFIQWADKLGSSRASLTSKPRCSCARSRRIRKALGGASQTWLGRMDMFFPAPELSYWYEKYTWLVVSTQLKNISQIGNLPQIGVKIKNIWNHRLDTTCWRKKFHSQPPFGCI